MPGCTASLSEPMAQSPREAAAALPGVVRVAEEQTAAVRRGGAAERDGVGPHVGVLAREQLLGGRGRRGLVRRTVGGSRGRGLCGRDAVHGAALSAEHGECEAVRRDVQGRHRTYPVRALAGGIGDPVLLQPRVVPGGEAPHRLLHLVARARGRRLGEELLHGARLADTPEVEVAGDVRRGGRQGAVGGSVGSEGAGALAAHGGESVGERAHLVGRLCPPGAEAQARVVLGDDVRNSVLGVADRGGQAAAVRVVLGPAVGAGGRRRERGRGAQRGQQGEADDREKSRAGAHRASQLE